MNITNPNAKRNYEIIDKLEVGIALTGCEVKSILKGRCNIRESFCIIKNGELQIVNMHISPYEFGARENKDPYRTRTLLAHKKEILKIWQKQKEKKLAIVPYRIYMKNNKFKLEIILGKGKKLYDKRQDLAKKDQQRRIERESLNYGK